MKNKSIIILILFIIIFGVLYVVFYTKVFVVKPEKLLKTKCLKCHFSLSMIENKRFTRLEWIKVLDKMQKKGANLNNKEYKIMLDYLEKNYGKNN